MKKSYFFIGIYLLVSIQSTMSQTLKIGDTVPDFEIENIINYTSERLRLSDINKKLIILDFWSTNCRGCIAGFRKLDSLQRAFKDEVQVVLINQSSRDSTERFFELRKKNVFKPDVIFMTADTVFEKLFPHKGVPYYVLLDSMRRVHFIPSGITFSSIRRFLQGSDIKLQAHTETEYLPSPVNEKIQGALLYSSFLFKTIPGIQLTVPANPGTTNITLDFASVALLYAAAFDENRNYLQTAWQLRPGKVVLNVGDPIRFIKPNDHDELDEYWMQNHSYSYQLVLPQKQEKNKYKVMRADLQRSFDLDAKIERRKVKCLTLVRTSSKEKLSAKAGKPFDNFVPTTSKSIALDSIKVYSNKAYSVFSERLGGIIEYFFKVPFKDATGFPRQKQITIQMSSDTLNSFDLETYREALRKYDLDLVEMEWPTNVLVLKEKRVVYAKKRE